MHTKLALIQCVIHKMGRVKRKRAFGHAQKVQIHSILRMCRVSSGLSFAIDTFYSIHCCWQLTAKVVIRLRICALIWAFPVHACPEGIASFCTAQINIQIQSTLVISNSKGLSEILRDIRTSTYQICRIEEKIIRTTTFNKYMCNWTLKIWRYIENIVEKRRNCSLGAISPLFHNILPVVRFSCLGRDQIFISR